MPRANPPPRHQIEDWPLIRWLLIALVALLVIAAIVTWWVRRQMRKPVPAPIPVRRLPWEEALSELAEHVKSPLMDPRNEATKGRVELFDKVSDTLRKYLGARYGFEGLGFDGLETTTDEMMTLLRRVRPAVPRLDVIDSFLTECDLVKFARVVPEATDCKLAIERAETVVRATIPVQPAMPGPAGPRPPGPHPGPPPGPQQRPIPPPPAFTPLPPKVGSSSEEPRL
jgi:hypothetical protein